MICSYCGLRGIDHPPARLAFGEESDRILRLCNGDLYHRETGKTDRQIADEISAQLGTLYGTSVSTSTLAESNLDGAKEEKTGGMCGRVCQFAECRNRCALKPGHTLRCRCQTFLSQAASGEYEIDEDTGKLTWKGSE